VVDTISDFVEDRTHTGGGGPITLDSLAATVGFSPVHFARMFKATTGMTPHAYVTEHRMMIAKDRLLHADARVVDVAAAVGFDNVSHFRRTFRRHFGVVPADLRA
jgi:AraC family transcriptional regulator